MRCFFEATDRSGRTLIGSVEAESLKLALRAVREMGLCFARWRSAPHAAITPWHRKKRLSRSAALLFVVPFVLLFAPLIALNAVLVMRRRPF